VEKGRKGIRSSPKPLQVFLSHNRFYQPLAYLPYPALGLINSAELMEEDIRSEDFSLLS
jgi:hypothetical protein